MTMSLNCIMKSLEMTSRCSFNVFTLTTIKPSVGLTNVCLVGTNSNGTIDDPSFHSITYYHLGGRDTLSTG